MNEQTGDPAVMGSNPQRPEPARPYDGQYQVHSIFLTIQGEGPFSGEASVFIRLAGCNLQCPMCDTEYTGTRDFDGPVTAVDLRKRAQQMVEGTACSLVVLTGGEPFRQDLADLVWSLREHGFRVQIETNGTMAPSDAFKEHCEQNFGVGIVVSPKAHFVDPWIANHAIAYKYVLSHDAVDPDDGLPTIVLGRKSQRVARPVYKMLPVYIQPADPAMLPYGYEELGEISKANHKAVIDSAIRYGHRAQIQIHKHFGVK